MVQPVFYGVFRVSTGHTIGWIVRLNEKVLHIVGTAEFERDDVVYFARLDSLFTGTGHVSSRSTDTGVGYDIVTVVHLAFHLTGRVAERASAGVADFILGRTRTHEAGRDGWIR